MRVIYGVIKLENGKVIRKPIILRDRKCGVCKQKFTPKRQDSKYCSDPCIKKADYKKNRKQYLKYQSEKYFSNRDERIKKRKEYYWSDPEKWRNATKQYNAKNKEKRKLQNEQYKDKTRHAGKRQELIAKNGLKCSRCGKVGNSFEIVAHHSNFDASDHSEQELLCRACHCKVHHWD